MKVLVGHPRPQTCLTLTQKLVYKLVVSYKHYMRRIYQVGYMGMIYNISG